MFCKEVKIFQWSPLHVFCICFLLCFCFLITALQEFTFSDSLFSKTNKQKKQPKISFISKTHLSNTAQPFVLFFLLPYLICFLTPCYFSVQSSGLADSEISCSDLIFSLCFIMIWPFMSLEVTQTLISLKCTLKAIKDTIMPAIKHQHFHGAQCPVSSSDLAHHVMTVFNRHVKAEE